MPISLLIALGLSVFFSSCTVEVGARFSGFVSRTADEVEAIFAKEASATLSFPAEAATYNQSLLARHVDMMAKPKSTGDKSPSGLRKTP